MSDESGLVGLLHRADWTRLALSAEVSDGSRVLIAPGGRYRYQDAEYVTGCDGGRPWELSRGDDDPDGTAHWVSGPEPPLRRLLCPAWLLEHSALLIEGRVLACGRDALDVAVISRPGEPGSLVPADDQPAPLRVLVDAELGILLGPRNSCPTASATLPTRPGCCDAGCPAAPGSRLVTGPPTGSTPAAGKATSRWR